MDTIIQAQGLVTLVVDLALLVLAIFAFVVSLTYSQEAYRAAGKWTKPAWAIVLGLGVLLQFVPVGGLIVRLALIIAALVYLADVWPALRSLRRR